MKPFLLFPIVLLAATAPPDPYHWPLDLPRVLTSSFGEYRPGRFHAGIDLRTGGIGLPVYAAADGHVSRVRCSPHGYGKAIYLQFNDGNSAVYGHLDDFPAPIRAFVRVKQHEAESYTVDLHCDPSQFPIKQGDLIAYSGQTGIGAPHLHYELRDAHGVPINPRLLHLTWPDVTPPEIHRVAIVPADADSLVEGGHEPVIRTVARGADGIYRCNPVRARGRIGLGADLIDPGDGGYNLGVHTLEAMTEGKPLFTVRHDRIDYDTNKLGALAYHPMLKHEGRFLLACRWPGNTHASYAGNATDGWLSVGERAIETTLRATDFHGNAIEVRVPIEPLEAGGSPAPLAGTSTKGEVEWQYWGSYLALKATFDAAELEEPTLHVDGAALPFTRLDDKNFTVALPAPKSIVTAQVTVLHPRIPMDPQTLGWFVPGQNGELRKGDATVEVSAHTPYGALPIVLTLHEDALSLWPQHAPINAPVTIRMKAPDPQPNASVYRKSGDSWGRVGGTFKDGTVEFTTTTLGTFAIKADTTPPLLAKISPPENYTAETTRPKIEATIKDDLSGIDKTDVRLDGNWLLIAYDPERGRIFWERDEDIAPGKHTITFTIIDAAGNTTTNTRTITIPPNARPAKPERP